MQNPRVIYAVTFLKAEEPQLMPADLIVGQAAAESMPHGETLACSSCMKLYLPCPERRHLMPFGEISLNKASNTANALR